MGDSQMVLYPIITLLAGSFITYLLGKLCYRLGRPKIIGGIAFLVFILSLYFLYLVSTIGGEAEFAIFGSQIYLRANGLALFLGVVSSILGALISLYSIRYMESVKGLEKYYALLVLMVTGITGIGFSGDLFNLFVFFELMAISSYSLVSFEKTRWEPIEAGMKYIVMSTAGATIALLGISFVFMNTGTLDLSQIDLASANQTFLTMGVILVIIGFGVKSAMVPVHTWLPDAHSAAPSGISAMLSGIVIQSGLVAMIKTLAIFPIEISFGVVLATFAVLTMTVGNLLALPQRNLKRMLAFSSIAQMGYIMLGIGLAFQDPTKAGVSGLTGGFFHILSHSFMKGGAFLCAGAILYTTGARSLEEMKGVGRKMPIVGVSFAIFILGLAGMPPLAGFIGELFIGKSAVDMGGWYLLFALSLVLNMTLSLGYYLPALNRVLFSSDFGKKAENAKEVPLSMLIPIVTMAIVVVLLGVVPQLGLEIVKPVVDFLMGVLGGG